MGVGVRSISDNSAKFAEFAAFGGVGVGVYDTSDNSAKFAEFAAFGGVGVGEFRLIRRIQECWEMDVRMRHL